MAIKVTKSQEDKRIDALQSKGSGGGVGENVGNHNERFNGYTAADGCTITSGDYNHAEGYKNTLTACQNTHSGGAENSITAGYCALMFGNNNTATPGSLNPAQVHTSSIGGYNNVIRGIIASMVLGQYNNVSDLVNSLVLGNSHTVANNTVVGGIVLGIGANTATVPQGRSGYVLCAANTSSVGNTFAVDIGGYVDAYRFIPQGADYAEYFEWADGNPDNEDRRGMLVALDEDKIVPAHDDNILGVVSAAPSVVGNSASLGWQGKFKRDVFGSVIKDKDGKPLLSDDYDPEKRYIPREQRPEWAAVGLVGRLVVIDDGNCVPNGYVSAKNGIGTASLSPTNIRVLRRIDDTHVEVFVK